MKKYLEAGEIVGTHGIKGEVRVNPWADSPEFLAQFKTLYFDGGETKLTVTASRAHKNVTLIKFKDIDTVEAAEALRGKVLWLDRADAHLPEGTFFIQDIEGLKVVDHETGEEYGVITGITPTVANDVWNVKHRDGNTYLMPVIDDIVKETDLDAGVVRIKVMKGLFGDAD